MCFNISKEESIKLIEDGSQQKKTMSMLGGGGSELGMGRGLVIIQGRLVLHDGKF